MKPGLVRQAISQRPMVLQSKLPSTVWEPDIRAFERADRQRPPPKGAAVFVGSSSLALWQTIEEDIPDFRVINRGFGGSVLADSLYFVDRIVLPYEPKVVVVYAGENDLEQATSPAEITEHFEALVARIHQKLPKTQIIYTSVKPSPRAEEAGLLSLQRELNEQIRDFARDKKNVGFLDIASRMVDTDGHTRPDLFGYDRWHMNRDGYRQWAAMVSNELGKFLPTKPRASADLYER
jgi:lysophospholipase L1-like esterase